MHAQHWCLHQVRCRVDWSDCKCVGRELYADDYLLRYARFNWRIYRLTDTGKLSVSDDDSGSSCYIYYYCNIVLSDRYALRALRDGAHHHHHCTSHDSHFSCHCYLGWVYLRLGLGIPVGRGHHNYRDCARWRQYRCIKWVTYVFRQPWSNHRRRHRRHKW